MRSWEERDGQEREEEGERRAERGVAVGQGGVFIYKSCAKQLKSRKGFRY